MSSFNPFAGPYRSRKQKTDVRRYGTTDEILFLEKLKKSNQTAFDAYRRTFYDRKQWGSIDPAEIAKHLSLPWPRQKLTLVE